MAFDWAHQVYLEGLRSWPGLELAFEDFAAHCSALYGPEEGCPPEARALVLTCACTRGHALALAILEQETAAVARAAIAHVHRHRDFVEETLQELWDRLLTGPAPKIARYTARGPLPAWVRVVASRTALDRCRSLGLMASRQVELTDWFAAADPGAERVLARERYGAAFQHALRESVAALPLRERNALRMHVTGGLSIDEIGRAYGVHRATAARWLERARLAIRDGLRQGLDRRQVRLTDSEFHSVALGLASELDLRLTGSFLASPSSMAGG